MAYPLVTCPSDIDVAAALWSSFGVCFHMCSLFFLGMLGCKPILVCFLAFCRLCSVPSMFLGARLGSCGLQMWWCPCWARLKLNLGSRIFFLAFYTCTTMAFIFRFHASLVFVHILSWFGATFFYRICASTCSLVLPNIIMLQRQHVLMFLI